MIEDFRADSGRARLGALALEQSVSSHIVIGRVG